MVNIQQVKYNILFRDLGKIPTLYENGYKYADTINDNRSIRQGSTIIAIENDGLRDI